MRFNHLSAVNGLIFRKHTQSFWLSVVFHLDLGSSSSSVQTYIQVLIMDGPQVANLSIPNLNFELPAVATAATRAANTGGSEQVQTSVASIVAGSYGWQGQVLESRSSSLVISPLNASVSVQCKSHCRV